MLDVAWVSKAPKFRSVEMANKLTLSALGAAVALLAVSAAYGQQAGRPTPTAR